MNTSSIVIFIVILIPAFLIVILIARLHRNQWRNVQNKQGKGAEFIGSLRHGIETSATVISRSETIVPNAGDFAKVDLVLEARFPGKEPVQIQTCWLVKLAALDQVTPGKSVPVIMDPEKIKQILPDIPWAKPWIFG